MEANIVCWLYDFKEPLATILAALTAAIVAPLIGLFVYRRQRESELVRARYLDNGLDVISNNAEYALGVFRHNWSRGLTTLKLFRGAGKDMPKVLYRSGYVELQPASYNTSHSFILNELLGDSIFHDAQQLLYSFVLTSNDYIIHDAGSAVRVSIEGGEAINFEESRKAIVETSFKKMEELNQDSNKYYLLLSALHDISTEFSRQKFRFKKVDSFKNQKIVKEKINSLKDVFSGDLAKYTGDESSNEPQPR